MSNRRSRLGVVSILIIVGASLTVLLATSGPAAGGPKPRFDRVDIRGKVEGRIGRDLARPVTVVLKLAGASVAEQRAAARRTGRAFSRAEGDSVRAGLRARQDGVAVRAQSAGAQVLARYQDALNGIKVRVPRSRLGGLGRIQGVQAVLPVGVFERDNEASAQYIGIPGVWGGLGFTGKGVKVGVIDSGIDYYHANFGGSGNPADFKADDGLTTDTRDSRGQVAFPSTKVVGGTDLVGDDYDASSENPALTTPKPDPDPLDCADGGIGGHGSHVAGSAAGQGVLADGSTFTGPYDAATLERDFEIGPGMAPEALLLAYRVFGCDGSTSVVVDAVDQAVKDGVDVINMSLGTPLGLRTTADAVAVRNATAAGVVVVQSAGNSGPNAYMAGRLADETISVAAMDTIPSFPGAVLSGGGLSHEVSAIVANEAPIPAPVTAPLHVLKNADGTIARGCEAAEYAGSAGKIVVTKRGVCPRVDRAKHGQAAGAVAVIMVNNSEALPPLEGPIPGVTIPFLGVREEEGAALLAADGTTVTLVAAPAITNPLFRHPSDFTSGGPDAEDNSLTPDVIAPGVGIKSTAAGTGTLGVRMSGTSMAGPIVAGVAALVTEAHPDWSTPKIKSAIMNTASADPAVVAGYHPLLAGSGLVQPRKAIETPVTATDGLSFGYRQLSDAFSATQPITFSNHGSSPVTYQLATAFEGDRLGATAAVAPTTVTVPAGGQATANVTVSLSRAAVAALPGADQQPGVLAQKVAGVVTATPQGDGAHPLRVPFLLVPRGISNIQPADVRRTQSGSRVRVTGRLVNRGVHGGAAEIFAWGLRDQRDGLRAADVRSVGVESLPGEAVGVPGDRAVVFAVNTYGRWATPSATEYDIGIDTQGDGNEDFLLVGIDLGVLTGELTGEMGAILVDANGDVVDAFTAVAPMNGSTILLPALASSLGLSAQRSTITYTAQAVDYTGIDIDVSGGQVDPVAGRARFDVFNPGISQGDFVALAPGASAPLALEAQRRARALGWLVVSFDDRTGAGQADRIPAG